MPGAPFVASLLLVVRPGAPSSFLLVHNIFQKKNKKNCHGHQWSERIRPHFGRVRAFGRPAASTVARTGALWPRGIRPEHPVPSRFRSKASPVPPGSLRSRPGPPRGKASAVSGLGFSLLMTNTKPHCKPVLKFETLGHCQNASLKAFEYL